MTKWNYLDLSWRLVLVFGCFNILFAVLAPLLSHLLFHKLFLFVSEDEQFTGIHWSDIVQLDQKLGLWILLLMDTGKGTMMGFGIPTVFLAWNGVREGERWALKAVFVSGLLSGLYSWTTTSLYFNEGLYNGVSGVSLGLWTTILLYSPWLSALGGVSGLLFSRSLHYHPSRGSLPPTPRLSSSRVFSDSASRAGDMQFSHPRAESRVLRGCEPVDMVSGRL